VWRQCLNNLWNAVSPLCERRRRVITSATSQPAQLQPYAQWSVKVDDTFH